MRYRLPEDCHGVSYGGAMLAVTPDGTVKAREDAAPHLAPHGLVPVETTAAAPKAAPPPQETRRR